MIVAIISPGDRVDRITKPLDTTDIPYVVNPKNPRHYDIVLCDTPDRDMLKEVIKNKFRDNCLIFRMRGDPYWGINHWMDSRIKQKIATGMLKYVDGCIALADHQANVYREKTNNPTELVPLSKDPYAWPQTTHKGIYLRIVTLTNPMYPTKIDPIIECMETVDSFLEDNEGKWYICGEGKYEERLEIAAKNYKYVNFVGYQDAKEVFDWANVLLHPSQFDSFANVILEGMASNLPVIASDHPAFTNQDWPIDIFSSNLELIKYLQRYKYEKERNYAGRHNFNYLCRNFTHEKVGKQWERALNYFYWMNTGFESAYERMKNE